MTHNVEAPESKYTQIIECFLSLNPDPSDDQVHHFAYSLGVDKEELESVFYAMLSERLDTHASPTQDDNWTGVAASLRVWAARQERTSIEATAMADNAMMQAHGILALTDEEQVLQDDYSSDQVPPQDIALNDDGPDVEDIEKTQDATTEDGLLVDDSQVPAIEQYDSDDSAIINDGAPAV
jgi:hypothetical protein